MKGLFHSQTAIISGGLGDIGRAIAMEMARAGANVALGDILPKARANTFLRDLESHSIHARYDHVDVSNALAVRRWVNKVEQNLGLATLIIPNAAIVEPARLCAVTPVAWSRQLRVNLDGAFHVAQAASLRLRHYRRPGRVVFIGSWAGHAPHLHVPAYCVAKAGLRMLCQCLALELAPYGILVNEVAPGYVAAGLSKQVWDRDPLLRRRSRRQVPLKKLIQPAEVARQVISLCHPDNQQMTGSVLLMDGGLSLRR